MRGHADCVDFVRSFNIPMLVVGGGGYTLRNVPRCWTFETAVVLETPVKVGPVYIRRSLTLTRCPAQDALPFNDYFEYYGPDYRLHLPVSNMENLNSPSYLQGVTQKVSRSAVVPCVIRFTLLEFCRSSISWTGYSLCLGDKFAPGKTGHI